MLAGPPPPRAVAGPEELKELEDGGTEELEDGGAEELEDDEVVFRVR